MAEQHYFVALRAVTGYSGSQSAILVLQSGLEQQINIITTLAGTIDNDQYLQLLRSTVEAFYQNNVGTIDYIQINRDNNFFMAYDGARGWLVDPKVDNQFDFDQIPVTTTVNTSDLMLLNVGGINKKLTATTLSKLLDYWNVSRVLYRNHTLVNLSDANTTETALRTIVIPGGTMGTLDSIRVSTWWNYPNSATIKSTRIKFGGQTIQQGDHSTTNSWIGQVTLSNRGTQGSQIGGRVSATSYGTAGSAVLGFSVDTSVDQNLVIAAAWGTAGSGTLNIGLESVIVEILRG